MHTDEVYRHSNWNTLTFYYKLRLIKLFHNVFVGEAPAALSYLTNKPCTAQNFRRSNNIIVLRFNSLLAIEALSSGTLLDLFYGQFSDFYPKMKKDFYFKTLDFTAQILFKCF